MKAIKSILLLLLSLPALVLAAAGDYVDYSGTVTLGGTSQTLRAATPNGGRTAITNLSTETEVLCVNVTSAASCTAAGSWHIKPGETLTLDSDELITVNAATTGHKFTAKRVTSGFDPAGPGAGAGGGGSGLTDTELRASAVAVTTGGIATATLTNVSASASSVTCLASNASRKRAIVFNDSASATLSVKAGATASATSFTWQVPPGGTLTLDALPVYTGVLDCIWSAATGAARVTEF